MEERERAEEEAEEARVWLAGLDRFNNAGLAGQGNPCVTACVDLSATPFYLGVNGYPEGSPFPWLVSDFGLVDAIESGIVKVPRLPVMDDTRAKDDAGRPDPKYFRLWRHVTDALGPRDRLSNGRPKPEAAYREAEGALVTLAGQWKQRFDGIRAGSVGDMPLTPDSGAGAGEGSNMVNEAFAGILGKRISAVVVKKGCDPNWQIFFLFDEGSYSEIYGSGGAASCTTLDRGGIDEVREYMAGSQQIVFEALGEGIAVEAGTGASPFAWVRVPQQWCSLRVRSSS